MLNGIRVYTNNNTWRRILNDLGAVIIADKNYSDIDIDSINLSLPISPITLKSSLLAMINAAHQKIINEIFEMPVTLSELQRQIIVMLYKIGPMSIGDLKPLLGFVPDSATHTIDTAIYNLRRAHGRDIIKNENGKYYIGKL